MKQKIKDCLAAIVYFLYEKGVLHNRIQVHTVDETIDELRIRKRAWCVSGTARS